MMIGAPSTRGSALALRPWDVVTGAVHGSTSDAPPLPVVGEQADGRRSFEAAVRQALERPPCVISFSGGRDSSAVLATAAFVARRSGLPPPIPATLRFRRAAEADESEWQELVVRHVGVDDWLRVTIDDELGLVGPVARTVLRRHGLLWPANTHLHVPLLAHASGGSLMTGVDGDGLFAAWKWTRRPRKRRLPAWKYLQHRVVGGGPRTVRRHAIGRRAYVPPWVQEDAHDDYASFRADQWSTEPWRWDARLRWYWRRRYLWTLQRSLALVAGDVDVQIIHPLLAPKFLSSLAVAGGRDGFGDRTAIMEYLFADLLPTALLRRSTQAFFDDVFWTSETRAFAATVAEIPHDELVDLEAARAEWAKPVPNFGSALLLQAAWQLSAGRS
jgi:asparagine synthase (glutamine-hydrolysing)